MPGVFLSYARKDGETRAAELRDRLTRDAPDVPIKRDRDLLEGGTGWWKQLTEAIDSVEFLILLMTPASLASGNVEKEWRYARQQGVCVYPVKGASDPDLHFADMPRWMSKSHFYDLDKEWPTFLAHLRKGCDRRRVPFMAPDLPPHFVQRPAEFDALKNLLLNPARTEPVAITTALSGAGGFGKTTLAAALCHDEDIVQNFDDGILWVTLGQTPDVLGTLLTAYAALTGDRPGFSPASWDRTLKVWDLESGRELRTLVGHSDEVSGTAVTPDGNWALSASRDKTLKLWDLETGRALRTLEGHSDVVSDVAVTPDGKRGVSASWDKTLKVWDLETGRELRTLGGCSHGVGRVAVTPDGKRIVSASYKTLRVWNLETGSSIATFHCDAPALCCAFADNRRIVAGDAGGRVYFLSLEEPPQS